MSDDVDTDETPLADMTLGDWLWVMGTTGGVQSFTSRRLATAILRNPRHLVDGLVNVGVLEPVGPYDPLYKLIQTRLDHQHQWVIDQSRSGNLNLYLSCSCGAHDWVQNPEGIWP